MPSDVFITLFTPSRAHQKAMLTPPEGGHRCAVYAVGVATSWGVRHLCVRLAHAIPLFLQKKVPYDGSESVALQALIEHSSPDQA